MAEQIDELFDKDHPTKEQIEEQIKAEAVAASRDLEHGLVALQNAKNARDDAQKRYERLRDHITPLLEGARYFIGENGAKYYAVRQQNDTMYVDLDVILDMIEAGELPVEILDEIAPRKVRNDAFKQAYRAERLNADQLTRCVKPKNKSTAFVRFHLFDSQ